MREIAAKHLQASKVNAEMYYIARELNHLILYQNFDDSYLSVKSDDNNQ